MLHAVLELSPRLEGRGPIEAEHLLARLRGNGYSRRPRGSLRCRVGFASAFAGERLQEAIFFESDTTP